MRSQLLLLPLFLLPACGGDSAEAERWNVVLVTLDTTRADALGSYGNRNNPTPVLDALAQEGAVFDLCISTAGVTPVSHASILTGLNPYTHGLRVMYAGSGYRLPDDIRSLPEHLKGEDYLTGAVLSSYPVSSDFGLGQGFDHFQWPDGESTADDSPMTFDGDRAMWNTSEFQQRSDNTTDQAIAWVDGVHPEEDPWFLWMHYWDPHDTAKLPPEAFVGEHMPGKSIATLNPGDKKRVYEVEVSYVDQEFGRFLDHLRSIGEYERTIFVVTADHGEGLGEHGWHAHRLLYQEQIHLPLLVVAPGLPQGTRIPDLVRTVDIVPTILELAKVKTGANFDGRSLVGLWNGEEEEPRYAYADQLNLLDANAKMVENRPKDKFLHVEMSREWKLIYRPDNPEGSELYNLLEDPDEGRNRYRDRRDIAEELTKRLLARSPDVIHMTPFPESEDGAAQLSMAALVALGYVDEKGAEDEAVEGEPEGEGDSGDPEDADR